MDDARQGELGRKVIFLSPRPPIAQELIGVVGREQYEVYEVHDPERLLAVLELPEFRDAVLFADIDTGLRPWEWEIYIGRLRQSAATRGVYVGVLSDKTDPAVMNRYLMEFGVQGGFIHPGAPAEMARHVLDALEAAGARGQRRYVRVSCATAGATVSVRVDTHRHGGVLRDLSVAGMACVLDRDPGIGPRTRLDEIEIRLGQRAVVLDGTVAGIRQENALRIHAVLFGPTGERGEELAELLRDIRQINMARLLQSVGRAG